MDESQELPEMEEVSLDKLLAEVAGTYDERACRHGGRAVCEPMPHTLVRGSTVHLGQLFGNLLDNAIRHGPPGGAVRVALGHQDDGWCTAVIHDDGGSIPPEHLSKLFDRFYRLDNSRARATGGTGLGLSISQEIARRHGGRIEIVSNRQAGTNVSVHLPRIAT
jgi:signal transduction histidine kinase